MTNGPEHERHKTVPMESGTEQRMFVAAGHYARLTEFLPKQAAQKMIVLGLQSLQMLHEQSQLVDFAERVYASHLTNLDTRLDEKIPVELPEKLKASIANFRTNFESFFVSTQVRRTDEAGHSVKEYIHSETEAFLIGLLRILAEGHKEVWEWAKCLPDGFGSTYEKLHEELWKKYATENSSVPRAVIARRKG